MNESINSYSLGLELWENIKKWYPQFFSEEMERTKQKYQSAYTYVGFGNKGMTARHIQNKISECLSSTQGYIGFEHSHPQTDFSILDTYATLEPTKCTCDIMALMRVGCKCGWIEKERAQ